MTIDDLLELRRLREISEHLEYFSAVALTGSVKEASAALNVDKKTVSTHIDWIERLIGRNLVLDTGAPCQPKQLTRFGKALWEGIQTDLPKTLRMLDAMRMKHVAVDKFVVTIHEPFIPRSDT